MHPATRLTLDLLGLHRDPDGKTMCGGFELAGRPPQYQSLRRFPLVALKPRASPAGQVWSIKDVDAALTALYGDWRTPNPWWDGMVSCKGQAELTLLSRCYAYERLLERWFAGQIDRTWAYACQIVLKDATDLAAVRVKNCLSSLLAPDNPAALTWPPVLKPGATA
jgi:hypothetical protein